MDTGADWEEINSTFPSAGVRLGSKKYLASDD